MRTTSFKVLVFGALLSAGCDSPNIIPIAGGSGRYDYLSYLQTMNKVRVTYIVETLHHTFLKQGVRDGGNASDLWLARQYTFENRDSTYPFIWKDSQFSTQACFTLELVDPQFGIASGCSPNSLIRGVLHNSTSTISDLTCQYQECEGCQDPNDYKAQNAYLNAPKLEPDAFSNDSVSFIVKTWNTGSISIGYMDDEVSYSTYIRQIQLTGFDSLGKDYAPICRVVFSK